MKNQGMSNGCFGLRKKKKEKKNGVGFLLTWKNGLSKLKWLLK